MKIHFWNVGASRFFIMVFKMRTNNILGFEQPLAKLWNLTHSEVRFQKTGGELSIFLKTEECSDRKQEETVLLLERFFPKRAIHFDGQRSGKLWFSIRPKKPAQISSS